LAGFACPWLPWAGYVGGYWSDYINQSRSVADRFEIFRPSFYVSNLLHEIDRYRPIGMSWVRPGMWTTLLGVPAALLSMLWWTKRRGDGAAFTLAAAAIVQVLLFALILKAKTYAYLIALWPLGALALAWLAVWVWNNQGVATLTRAGLLALLALIIAEGAMRMAHMWKMAEKTTPYEHFTSKVAACIPSDSLVLGLQHYWLGLRQFPYRSWLVPIYHTLPLYHPEPVAMDEALERVRPDVILIDRHMQEYLDLRSGPDDKEHSSYKAFHTFMDRHRVQVACVVEDEIYGAMRVYHVSR
jgi:hypothetical protein